MDKRLSLSSRQNMGMLIFNCYRDKIMFHILLLSYFYILYYWNILILLEERLLLHL